MRGRLNFLQQNALCKSLYIVAEVVLVSYIYIYRDQRDRDAGVVGALGLRAVDILIILHTLHYHVVSVCVCVGWWRY